MSEPLADRLKASVPGPSAPVDPARLWRLARRRRVAKRGGVAGVLAAGIAVVIAVMPPAEPQDDIVFEATPQQPAQAAAGAGSAGGRTNEQQGPQTHSEIRYGPRSEALIACIEDAGFPVQRSLGSWSPRPQPQLEEGVLHAVTLGCQERLVREQERAVRQEMQRLEQLAEARRREQEHAVRQEVQRLEQLAEARRREQEQVVREDMQRLEQLVGAMRCLRKAGVDVADAPDIPAFLDDPSWSSYDEAGVAAGFEPGEARRIRDACPDPVLAPLRWVVPGDPLD